MKITATAAAWAFAASFYASGIAGFVPNPLLGEDGLFAANAAHNAVHLLTGLGFTAVALAGRKASVVFMKVFGVVYALTGAAGFLATGHGDGHLLGLVHINTLDNFLHLGLGAVIGLAGWYFGSQPASESPKLSVCCA